MVFVHYQHRAYNNMQMSCTTHVRIQIQNNVTRTMDLVCVSIRTEGLSPSMASITNMLYRLPY